GDGRALPSRGDCHAGRRRCGHRRDRQQERRPTKRLRIAPIAPVATALPPSGSGSVELVTWLLTEGLVRRGHDVTLFATGDTTTSAKLAACYPHGYWHDTTMWRWELYEMLTLAAAVERAAEFDIIHFQAAYYPLSL